MIRDNRTDAVMAMPVAPAGLGCGSSGAGAAQNQGAADELFKSLTKLEPLDRNDGSVGKRTITWNLSR
jgi:hypothetical protein